MPNPNLMVGQRFNGVAKRTTGGQVETLPFTLEAVGDVVMCGGKWHPGLLLVPADRGQFSFFEAEFIELSINEGQEYARETDPDTLEEDTSLFSYEVQREPLSVEISPQVAAPVRNQGFQP